MYDARANWCVIQVVLLVMTCRHNAAVDLMGYCSSDKINAWRDLDLRCVRHNYSDFRDTHKHDLYGYHREDHLCHVIECDVVFKNMREKCPHNMTRECLNASRGHPSLPLCLYLPSEIPKDIQIHIPSLYELRISDDLYEMEKSIDWCNDGSKGRSFNGSYVLCREEKDVWRVMSEFGRRAPHCIRYYIRKYFQKTEEYNVFVRDMTKECSTFENEMTKNKEKDFIRTETTERHSLAINTFNACCFLKKAAIIERFPCVEEATTPWPETPAPTGELRNESNILVLSIEENGLNRNSNTIVLCSVLFSLLW